MIDRLKILIVVPTDGYDNDRFRFKTSADFPTGLAYIAAALKVAGHEVHGLNPNNDINYDSPIKMMKEKLTAKLEEIKYDIVCLGGLCIHFAFLQDSIKLIRQVSPQSKIVLGGGIVTDDDKFIFKTLLPDFAISGQGEETIVQLMEAIEVGLENYNHIPNLSYWKNGEAQHTPITFKYGNIDHRAFPDYSIFDMDNMLDYGGLHNNNLFRYPRTHPRVMSIITALGCPFKCTFCVHETIHRYKERSIPRIMEEIKELYSQYHFNILIILDELFAIKRDRLYEFCEELIKQRELQGWDFNWQFQTHASADLTLEDLQLLKRAGCFYFSYGIESTSPSVLESMKKKTKPAQILNAIELSRKTKIGFGGNFIFGDIAETLKSTNESITFFAKNCLDMHINLGIIHPYPGSKLFSDYFKEKNYGDLERLEFYKNIDKEYINLTSLDDNLWTLISRELFKLANFRWEKTTHALSWQKEEPSIDTPWAQKVNGEIYKINAICPYCEHNFELREIVGTKDRRDLAFESATKHKFIFSKPYEQPKNPELKREAEELLKTFKSIDTSATKGQDFVNSACPNCNRRFNIILNR